MTPSAEDPNSLWVNIVMPSDEDRRIALREMASEISTDILLDLGHHITVSTGVTMDKKVA